MNFFEQSVVLIEAYREERSLQGIPPGGVNFFEQSVVLGEAYREEQVKGTALTAGRFRATCLSRPGFQHGMRVWPGLL